MDAHYYLKDLHSRFFSTADEFHGDGMALQQDIAAVYSYYVIKNFIEAYAFEILDSPTNSPNLNIIETFWKQLVSRIYANDWHLNPVPNFMDSIVNSWTCIYLKYICGL